MAQWQSAGMMIEKLLTPGSIPALSMRRRVLGKDILRPIPSGLSSLPAEMAQPDERLAKRTKKSVSALV